MTQYTRDPDEPAGETERAKLSNLPVYLINLDGSDDRLAEARRQLDIAGVPFERVPAFDGRELRIEEFPDYAPESAMSYMGRPLRGGEIGCYLSHIDCARRFLDTSAPACVVLEDDMKLRAGFPEGTEAVIDWLQQNDPSWEVVNIGANSLKIHTPALRFGPGDRPYQLSRAHYFPTTTTGLIWSRAGASALIQQHERIFAPVDLYLRHWQTRRNRGWAVLPGLVTTTGVDSVIAPGISPRREAGDRHILYGLIKQRRVWLNKIEAYRNRWRMR